MDHHAGSRPRQADQLAARRRAYHHRRSQTVSTLPMISLHDNELSGGKAPKTSNQALQVKTIGDNVIVDPLSSAGDLSPRVRRSTDVLDGFKKTWSLRSTSPRQRATLIGGGGGQTLLHPDKTRERLPLCRTPSSPSILLSKVRERIKEKVIETSIEWPCMAAIVQEKRQKAVSAFEAQLSQQVHGVLVVSHHEDVLGLKQNCASRLVVKKVLTQSRSSTGEMTSIRERSRLELRRRSISMDTFERMSRPSAELGGGGCGGSAGGGVVCTTDDLKSIMNSHREDNSRQNPTTVVVDRSQNFQRKSSSLREHRNKAAAAVKTSVGPNLDDNVRPESETDRNSNPTPSSNALDVPLPSCAPLYESTTNAAAFSSTGSPPQRLEASPRPPPHMTLFRSSSANTSSVKVKSPASAGNRKGFFFRRSASVCNTSCREKTSPPVQPPPVHHLEETSVTCHLRTSSTTFKDHAGHRTRFPSICSSSPRKGKTTGGSEHAVEIGLVYPSNDFDPEIIGQAIQIHLETMMRSRNSSGELGN